MSWNYSRFNYDNDKDGDGDYNGDGYCDENAYMWTMDICPTQKVFQESKTEYYSMDQKVENIEIFEER